MSTELSTKIESRINKTVAGNTGLTRTGSLAFANMEQIMEFSKVMSVADVAIPKHLRERPGACLAVAIQASEWEMSPFAVANKSYVVNDRIAFEAQMVNAVILRRAPIVGRLKVEYSGEGEKRKCKVSAKLDDGDMVDYESPEFGKIPVKNSPLWKADPDQQLFYYSSRAMCRRHFPDVLLGVYTPEELAAEMRERETAGRVLGPSFNQSQPEAPQAEPAPSAAVVETPPVETPAPTEESFALDGSPPSQIDLLRDLMAEHDVDMPALRGVIAKAKLAHGSKVNKLSEMDPALLKTLIENWDDVLSHLGREAA